MFALYGEQSIVHVVMCKHAHVMWRPEVDISVFPYCLLLISFTEALSLAQPRELTDSASVASQLTLELIYLCLLGAEMWVLMI